MIHDPRRELELLRDERVDAVRIVGTDHAPGFGPEDTQTGVPIPWVYWFRGFRISCIFGGGVVVVELRVASSASAQRDAQVVDVPHELHAVRLRLEPDVDLQERDYPFIFPKIRSGGFSSDRPSERGVGEEYRPEHLFAVEGFGGDDARPHGVRRVEHLRLVPGAYVAHAVERERARSAPAGLVERCYEARL